MPEQVLMQTALCGFYKYSYSGSILIYTCWIVDSDWAEGIDNSSGISIDHNSDYWTLFMFIFYSQS